MSNRIQNMPKRLTALSVFITLSLLIGACGREAEKANIEFMEYGQDYRGKPMFARLEHKLPIADTREHREQLARVTPAYLAGLDQEQVDQIYARLTAGPIPDGPYDGSLFFPQGSSGKLRASEIVGGLKGLAVRVKGKNWRFSARYCGKVRSSTGTRWFSATGSRIWQCWHQSSTMSSTCPRSRSTPGIPG